MDLSEIIKSMDWKLIIRGLLTLGVSLLGQLIPWIGGFVGGPFGFIASWGISWLTGILFDMVERLARFAAIDAQVHKDVVEARAAQVALVAVQANTETTEVEREKAIADFAAAVRALGKFRV